MGWPPVLLPHVSERLPSGWVWMLGVVHVAPPGSDIVRAETGRVKSEAATAAIATAVRRSRDFVWGWVMASSLSAGPGASTGPLPENSLIFLMIRIVLHIWREV